MNNSMTSILYVALAITAFLLMVLIMAYFVIKAKEKKEEEMVTTKETEEVKPSSKTKLAKEYEIKSIFDFMEFENVKDNMIVQKEGKKYLMVIECKGVNYDLMSEVEKTSTEQGFASFLNTLKEPIQIYIQTRTVNLEQNIQVYKQRLNKIRDSLNLKQYKFKQYMENETVNEKEVKDRKFELLRESNLYDYGRDIIADTERMSLNKNILKKKYFIVIRYFYEPLDVTTEEDEDVLSKEEIADAAFSNLYTRATSMIRVLSGVGIVGKALNSYELVDLLYNAYNRDDSEVFGIDKAIDAGYNEIYIDAQSSINKKIDALNREIEIKAKQKVEDALASIEDERKKELQEIEENFEDIIVELAKKMIEDENVNIPKADKEKVIKKIEKKGEEKINGKKQTKETSKKARI